MQVFYASPWLPPEFIEAHGLEPRGVWSPRHSNQLPLAAGVCPFAQTVLQLAETRPDSLFVFSTHCDQLRRAYDAVGQAASARVFLFNLPATWQTAVAERLFGSELERLGRFLVQQGGRPPTAQALAESMARYRLARSRLLAAATHLSGCQYGEALDRFHWDGTVGLSQAAPAARPDSIPLALVGGPLPSWQLPVLDAIESAGGHVVLNATETGERSLGQAYSSDPMPAGGGAVPELLASLTRSCLERCVDVFQRPNTRLFQWLKERLAERRARGILLCCFVGCDLWRAEAQPLREAFGLPVLLLDANETAGDASRRSGRIQAFLESLA